VSARLAALVTAAIGLGVAQPTFAHESSLAYLSLDVDGGRVAGRWDIALRDLEDAVGMDSNGDGALTWGEFEAHRDAVLALAQSRLRIAADGTPCATRLGNTALERRGDATFAVLEVDADCAANAAGITVDYTFLFDIDATHRALLELSAAGRATSAVLSREQPSSTTDIATLSPWDGFVRFAAEGVNHIWHGYDHLVFLALLLLPAVLRPVRARTDETIKRVIGVVTAFTLAHSLTLALATYGVVSVSARGVEAVIAASIVVAALLNLVPRAPLMGAPLAFGFGLVHGLGFATALAGLGGNRLMSLAGFNLGVELGQLALVAVAVPLLFALRRSEPLRLRALTALSLACAGVGSMWLAQRLI
jgi:hypothetical protein